MDSMQDLEVVSNRHRVYIDREDSSILWGFGSSWQKVIKEDEGIVELGSGLKISFAKNETGFSCTYPYAIRWAKYLLSEERTEALDQVFVELFRGDLDIDSFCPVEGFDFDPHGETVKSICELYEKGFRNATPIMAHLNRNAQEAKRILGSGLWKKLCKCSFEENKLLAENENQFFWSYNEESNYRENYGTLLGLLLKMPEDFLRTHGARGTAHTTWIHGLSKEQLRLVFESAHRHLDQSDGLEIYLERHLHLIADTIRAAEALGERYNPRWSPTRMMREHDRMVEIHKKAKRNSLPPDLGIETYEGNGVSGKVLLFPERP